MPIATTVQSHQVMYVLERARRKNLRTNFAIVENAVESLFAAP